MPRNWLSGSIGGLASQFAGISASPRIAPTPRITSSVPVTTPANPVAVPNLPVTTPAPAYHPLGVQAMGRTVGVSDAPMYQPLPVQRMDPIPYTNAVAGIGAGVANQWSGGGMAGVAGGQWATLDQSNNEINTAAGQFGVPANLLKAMINNESSGDWGRDGNRVVGLRGDELLPFVGIFRGTAQSWGLDFDSMVGNKQAQINGMAKILSGLASQYGGYENAAKVYFGGENALNGGFTDENGMDSNTYFNHAMTTWHTLDSMTGSTTGTTPGFGAGNAWDNIVRGGTNADWGEFGAASGNGLYGYGTQYGLNGTQHTGVDIVTPYGSTYVAPMGGTVMCAGTGVGTATDGSSCGFFQDMKGGAGRVEVLLDNGAVLIYGHSSQSYLQPGQHFDAGTALGASGYDNSDHIHLEARVRDASMPSGWRIVDPRTVMGGSGGGWGGGTTAPNTGNGWYDRNPGGYWGRR